MCAVTRRGSKFKTNIGDYHDNGSSITGESGGCSSFLLLARKRLETPRYPFGAALMTWGEMDPFEPPKSNPADEVDGREVVERVLAGVADEAHIGGLVAVSAKVSYTVSSPGCYELSVHLDDASEGRYFANGSKVMLIVEPEGRL